jgi:hypothetical protein
MKDIAYIAIIVLLLLVVKSDYNEYTMKSYSILSPPIRLYYENNILGFSTVTVEDKRGYRVSLSGFSSIANRISNEYEVGEIIKIKQDTNYYKPVK